VTESETTRSARSHSSRDAQHHFVGLGEHGVHRDHDGLRDLIEQVDEPFAALAAKEPVLVLDVEDLGRMAIDEARDFLIRVAILFAQASDHFGRIPACFTAGLVDRDHIGARSEGLVERGFHIMHERGDATLTRRIRTK
jgi:hypothetical protein